MLTTFPQIGGLYWGKLPQNDPARLEEILTTLASWRIVIFNDANLGHPKYPDRDKTAFPGAPRAVLDRSQGLCSPLASFNAMAVPIVHRNGVPTWEVPYHWHIGLMAFHLAQGHKAWLEHQGEPVWNWEGESTRDRVFDITNREFAQALAERVRTHFAGIEGLVGLHGDECHLDRSVLKYKRTEEGEMPYIDMDTAAAEVTLAYSNFWRQVRSGFMVNGTYEIERVPFFARGRFRQDVASVDTKPLLEKQRNEGDVVRLPMRLSVIHGAYPMTPADTAIMASILGAAYQYTVGGKGPFDSHRQPEPFPLGSFGPPEEFTGEVTDWNDTVVVSTVPDDRGLEGAGWIRRFQNARLYFNSNQPPNVFAEGRGRPVPVTFRDVPGHGTIQLPAGTGFVAWNNRVTVTNPGLEVRA
jgi:hypothetical protein